jgi:hypothetical protein|tara:strand:- start:2878 stop:3147 length:270 start_codon:yes stop_codon:yes gene_type:complete
MGKLTLKQAESLLTEGILDEATFKQMQVDGLISEGRGTTRRYVKTKSGTWVSPMLYFAGLKGATYSKNMIELKAEVNKVIEKYTNGEKS